LRPNGVNVFGGNIHTTTTDTEALTQIQSLKSIKI